MDWWALGVLMFEMMAGRSPFDIITDNPDMNTEDYLFQGERTGAEAVLETNLWSSLPQGSASDDHHICSHSYSGEAHSDPTVSLSQGLARPQGIPQQGGPPPTRAHMTHCPYMPNHA